MLAIPFENTNGKGVSLNDLKFSNPKAAIGALNADQIKLWVWDESKQSYDYESWFLKSSGWYNVKTTSLSFDKAYENGLPPGTVFWYAPYPKDAPETYTSSGEVSPDVSVVRTIWRKGYNFVSYPYPTPLNLNDANQVDWGNCTSALGAANADQIKLWVYDETVEQYNYESWYKKTGGWYSVKSTTTKFETLHPNGVTVGTGFWYYPKDKAGLSETFDITFKSPIAKSAE